MTDEDYLRTNLKIKGFENQLTELLQIECSRETRIYGGPTGNINSKKELFQIPSGYKALIVLRIGNVDKSVDAVSAASPRKKFEEVVNYKK